jgi:hypothetical protein
MGKQQRGWQDVEYQRGWQDVEYVLGYFGKRVGEARKLPIGYMSYFIF